MPSSMHNLIVHAYVIILSFMCACCKANLIIKNNNNRDLRTPLFCYVAVAPTCLNVRTSNLVWKLLLHRSNSWSSWMIKNLRDYCMVGVRKYEAFENWGIALDTISSQGAHHLEIISALRRNRVWFTKLRYCLKTTSQTNDKRCSCPARTRTRLEI